MIMQEHQQILQPKYVGVRSPDLNGMIPCEGGKFPTSDLQEVVGLQSLQTPESSFTDGRTRTRAWYSAAFSSMSSFSSTHISRL